VTGAWWRDGLSVNGGAVPNQNILVATHVETDDNDPTNPVAGLMGLMHNHRNVASNFAAQAGVPNEYAILLTYNGGNIYLGGRPNNLVNANNYATVQVLPAALDQNDGYYGHWLFHLDRIQIGNQAVPGPWEAIPDSGSNRIYAPHAVVNHFYTMLGGEWVADPQDNNNWALAYPCDFARDIIFRIGGFDFPISHGTFNLGRVEAQPHLCISAVQRNDDPEDEVWILGGAFMKNVLSVFDEANTRISFGRLRNPPVR